MAEAVLRYAVLLARPEPWDVQALAKALARQRGCPVEDVMSAARGCWGILAEGQEEASAKVLAAALTSAGISALALPQNLVEDLPPAAVVAKARLGPDGAVFLSADGEPHPVRPEGVLLLSACVVKRSVTQVIKLQEDIGFVKKVMQIGCLLAAGMPLRTAKLRREIDRSVTSAELFGTLDIHLQAPPRRLRVEMQGFDYSCLGARKGYEAMGNFRMLVRELAVLWPGAVQSRGARLIVEGSPPGQMGYESVADLEREARWLQTLRTLRT